MQEFFIHPDIRKARTLPSRFYTDEDCFERAKEKIFSRSWQFLGRSEDFDVLTPITLLPGFLDEPVLVVLDGAGIRCLSNVCTHRGKVLVDEPCRANLIRCSYHGRRFDLTGKFLSMPEFDRVEDFPGAADNLAQIPTANVGGFLFAGLSPQTPLSEFAGESISLLENAPRERFNAVSTKDYEVHAHWALYCENYLEGFHIPFVHGSLNEVIDYGSYTTETFRYSSLQTAYEENGAVAGKYLFIFPNLMFNFYPWGVSVNVVQPINPGSCRVRFLTYLSDESKFGTGAGGDLHRVELEDEAVVESVQKGIRSRFYTQGRYSPSREQGTHHFHRLIAEFME